MGKVKTLLFWLLSCTWGSIMTLFGICCALVLLITGHRPHRFICFIWFEVGRNWGGFEAGGFFVVNHGATEKLKQHEAGHGLQNIIFGPLTPFLISIPSAIRYWIRRYNSRRGKALPPYDSVWYEAMASRLGNKYFSSN